MVWNAGPNGQDPGAGTLEGNAADSRTTGADGGAEQPGDDVTTTPTSDIDGPAEARKVFHEQLDELRVDVIRLAALTTEQIAGGTQALLDGDLTAAERVIEADDAIDELTHSVEDRTFQTLALQQPIATDLRFLVTVMRVAHELERSADLMVNVAKTTRRLYPHQLDPKLRGHHRPHGRAGERADAGRDRRVRRRRPVTGRRARRHGRRDGRAHQEPVPAHPRGRRQRRRPRCFRQCRWHWWAATTSARPTTR